MSRAPSSKRDPSKDVMPGPAKDSPARQVGVKPGKGPVKVDPVQKASEDSFPASDPPAHGGSTGGARKDDTAGADERACTPDEKKNAAPTKPKPKIDKVDEASEESFPASDPPGGTSHA